MVFNVFDKDVLLLWLFGVIVIFVGLFYECGINLESNRCVNVIIELDWLNIDFLLIMDDYYYI